MSFLSPGQPVRAGLYWAAGLYGLIAHIRRWCYRHGWLFTTRLPCLVISVGNLTVGGTGKTPFVIFLAQRLMAKGRRVAILSRGYKRTSHAPHVLVSDGVRLLSDSSESGDEPFLMAQRCPHTVVAVGANRVALGRWVLERHPVDCMILDDGFQHLALHRDVDLVLLDATDAVGLDALLPAGRLREPLHGLDRASAVVITRADFRHDVDAVRSRLRRIPCLSDDAIEVVFRPESFIAIRSGASQSIEWGEGKKAWLVSGIGNSLSFRRSAESVGIEIVGETMFEDHHRYSLREIEAVRTKVQGSGSDIVLTTEKDGGKLASLLSVNDAWWMLRLETDVVRGADRLSRLIDGALSRSSPSECHA